MSQYDKTMSKFNSTDTSVGSSVGTRDIKSTAGFNNNGFVQDDLEVWIKDASAVSGSKLTRINDLNSVYETLGDAGDQILFGSPVQCWGIYSSLLTAKSNEQYIGKYYSSSLADLKETTYMSVVDEFLNQNKTNVFEALVSNNITMNKKIRLDWMSNTPSGILDKIPATNDGVNRYWWALEVPVGGLTTTPRLIDTAYRGSGLSKIEYNQQDVYWGNARLQDQKNINTDNIRTPSGTPVVSIDITSTQVQLVYNMRSALNDNVVFRWQLPVGIDTSTPIDIDFSYIANAAINTADINIDIKKLTQGSIVGAGETSDLNQTENINITAGNTINLCHNLATDFDISDMKPFDILSIEVIRTDSNGGSFYPLHSCIKHTLFKMGKFS